MRFFLTLSHLYLVNNRLAGLNMKRVNIMEFTLIFLRKYITILFIYFSVLFGAVVILSTLTFIWC